MKRIIALCVLALTASHTMAAEEEGPWSAKAGLGYLATSGNSDTTNLNGVFNVGYGIGRWNHGLDLLAVRAETDGVKTAQRFAVGYKSKWDIHEWDYLYGGIDYEKDDFSGVEKSLSTTAGYGRRFINNEVHVLNGEIGVGYRQQDFADTFDANGLLIPGGDDSSAIVRLGGDYLYNFSETAFFTQALTVEIGGDNTSIEAVSGINAKLRDALALVLSYTVKNNSDVPAGLTNTDTYTSINLEYTF